MELFRIYEGISILDETGEVPYRRYEPKIKEEQVADFQFKPGFFNQMGQFIESCVEKKNKKDHGCNLREALQVTELCEAIRG
jgi:hypothetical protein